MKQGTNKNLMHFKEQFLRQAEVLQDPYGIAWFQNFEGTTKDLIYFKEQFLRQAEVLQDLYGIAWFQNFAVKTKAYAAIASTSTAAKDKFMDDIFKAVLATGFLCNCD
ncbi:unnamed protein product [Cylindrotheca closterium]|uniref:Uncharacterized protein n=1 Tax=Cylindrotheca closterium TaxID=2856 RepID=A0AAD2PX42_9STRA|nr:unnamed protein product [Cylindrotheca closterium]